MVQEKGRRKGYNGIRDQEAKLKTVAGELIK
jgi:hypothetical protein